MSRTLPLWIVKIGLFIVPFIPLVVGRTLFFPYITGKAFVFKTVVEIVLAAWIFLVAFHKEYRPQLTYLIWAVAIFIGIVTLATIFGVNPYRSFWSNYERMEGLVSHLHLLAYFLVLGSVFDKKSWKIFFILNVIAGFLQNVYALLQKLGVFESKQGGFRVDGTIGNPTYVAAYLIFILAFTILLFMGTEKRWLRYLYGLSAAFTLLTIYFTSTRGAIIALAIGFFAGAVLYLVFERTKTAKDVLVKRVVIGILLALIVSGGALKVFRGSDFVKHSEVLSHLASVSLAEGKSRFTIWNMGLQGFKERPILGWGPENYNLIFAKYYNPTLYTQEPWFDRSHNIIFDWLINAGILGLLSYLGVFFTVIYLLWVFASRHDEGEIQNRHRKRVAALISLLLFVYFVQNLFVFDQLATYIGFYAILAYVQFLVLGEKKPAKERLSQNDDRSFLMFAVVITLLISLGVTIYDVNYKTFAANRDLLEAIYSRDAKTAPRGLELFEHALAYASMGNGEIREHLAQFAMAVLGNADVDNDFKAKLYNRAVQEARISTEENPGDPRTHIFLGALLSAGGEYDKAIEVLKKSVDLAPRKQQIYFELADVYIRKQDYVSSAKVLEEAFKLEPNFDTARLHAIAGYILNREQDKADKLLIEGYGKVDIAEPLLTQVYLRTGQIDRLLGIWKAFVTSEPGNIKYRKNLAAVYLDLGKKKEAIAVLEEAVKIDPSFRAEADQYIKEIKAIK